MTEPILGSCHGKLNWWLKVGAVRSDGFHEIETVYQELEFAEQVTISKSHDEECILTGFPLDISPETNLVTRAWNSMRARFPDQILGIHLSIIKTLPQGGGIGGGSSNAAWVISAINQLYQLDAPRNVLREVAAEIGSDVAFFVDGGTAIGRGRGEMLEELPPAPKYWLVLVMPEQRMPTAEGFHQLDKFREDAVDAGVLPHTLSQFLTALYSGNADELSRAMSNDFELVAENLPWFQECKNRLLSAGAKAVLLCGSGSTVAGLVDNEAEALRIAEAVGGIATSSRG